MWRFDLARESFEKAGDLSALMLLLMATGDRAGLQSLAAKAGTSITPCLHASPLYPRIKYRCSQFNTKRVEEKGANNLAFATLFQLGNADACVDLLVNTKRAPEAALFARTYAPRCDPLPSHASLPNSR